MCRRVQPEAARRRAEECVLRGERCPDLVKQIGALRRFGETANPGKRSHSGLPLRACAQLPAAQARPAPHPPDSASARCGADRPTRRNNPDLDQYDQGSFVAMPASLAEQAFAP